MHQVIVSTHAWIPKAALGEADVFLMKKKLSLTPKVAQDFAQDELPKVVRCWRETDEYLGVPREWFRASALRDRWPIKLVVAQPPMPNHATMKPLQLRADDQEPVLELWTKKVHTQPFAGGIIQAYTGFGKTVAGIEQARRLGTRTMILVHTNPLLEQWEERIRAFFPTARVGRVQGPKCEFEGCDFVIGMIQSMMGERIAKYPKELFEAFGLVISDEVHRMGAEAFSTVAPSFTARWAMGLSGTVYRSDGLDEVFKWQIGEIVATAKDKNKVQPIVYVRETGFRPLRRDVHPYSKKVCEFDCNSFKKPMLLNIIAANQHRNKLIASDIVAALKKNRCPLVVAERLELLDGVSREVMLLAPSVLGREVSQGFYIGGKKKADLAKAAASDVVYATLQIAKEGIDITKLDTLFLTTPVSDQVQVIGRIGRTQTMRDENGQVKVVPPKNQPMVVDYVDSELTRFASSFRSRLRKYRQLKCNLIGKGLEKWANQKKEGYEW